MRDILADQILLAVSQIHGHQITGFLAARGNAYRHQLMVVGRAVNGWADGILTQNLADDVIRNEYADRVAATVTPNEQQRDPMAWVANDWGAEDHYNPARSAFWRAIRQTVSGLGIADINDPHAPWSSHLVWSNLYKISPTNGGNPGAALMNAQHAGCRILLSHELCVFRPKRILFLTGWNWAAPFVGHLLGGPEIQQGHVQHAGILNVPHAPNPIHCVVACHPQGRNENEWVNAVLQQFLANPS